ncbi:hypothetical protein DFH06DRAFT_1137484 [Mycena polygramma]|nr:hypothetical protein DFH06DRAFT_1137484 [Mycena polygramma]
MAPLLAGFRSALDIDLGAPRVTTNREVIQRYQESGTGRPLKTLVVGVLKGIIDRKNARSILVLESPGPSSLVLQDMFKKQLRILNDLMLQEGQNSNLCIINKDLWSQGPSGTHAGRIFVRVSKGTHIVRWSNPESPLTIIAPEVPVACDRPKCLTVGSLIMCYATMLRVDIPVFRSSATEPVFSRGYGMHAVRIVHLFRSDKATQHSVDDREDQRLRIPA